MAYGDAHPGDQGAGYGSRRETERDRQLQPEATAGEHGDHDGECKEFRLHGETVSRNA